MIRLRSSTTTAPTFAREHRLRCAITRATSIQVRSQSGRMLNAHLIHVGHVLGMTVTELGPSAATSRRVRAPVVDDHLHQHLPIVGDRRHLKTSSWLAWRRPTLVGRRGWPPHTRVVGSHRRSSCEYRAAAQASLAPQQFRFVPLAWPPAERSCTAHTYSRVVGIAEPSRVVTAASGWSGSRPSS